MAYAPDSVYSSRSLRAPKPQPPVGVICSRMEVSQNANPNTKGAYPSLQKNPSPTPPEALPRSLSLSAQTGRSAAQTGRLAAMCCLEVTHNLGSGVCKGMIRI